MIVANASWVSNQVTKSVGCAPSPPAAFRPAHAFAITDKELAELERDIDRDLAALVRRTALRFDLQGTLARFDQLWGKTPGDSDAGA